jgi:hypothetical protein
MVIPGPSLTPLPAGFKNGSVRSRRDFLKNSVQPEAASLRPTSWYFEEIRLFPWNLPGWPDMIHLIR